MRKKHYTYLCLSLLTLVIMYSCLSQNDFLGKADAGETLSIRQARKYFDQQLAKAPKLTRGNTKDGNCTHTIFSLSVDFKPMWHEGVISSNALGAYVNVPFESSRSLRAVRKTADSLKMSSVPIYEKYIIAKNPQNGKINSFLLVMIPDEDFEHKNLRNGGRKFTYGGSGNDFSGLMLFYSVSGDLLRFNRYVEGRDLGGLYMYDTRIADSTKHKIINDVLGGIRLEVQIRLATRSEEFGFGGATFCYYCQTSLDLCTNVCGEEGDGEPHKPLIPVCAVCQFTFCICESMNDWIGGGGLPSGGGGSSNIYNGYNLDAPYGPLGDKYPWNRLTAAEKKFVISYPLLAKAYHENSAKASNAVSTMAGQHNGEADAMRHAYWCALNTNHSYNLDAYYAKLFGNAHEDQPNQASNEKDMDLHNNAVGYEIGIHALKNGWGDTQIWNEVINAKNDGRLQLNVK